MTYRHRVEPRRVYDDGYMEILPARPCDAQPAAKVLVYGRLPPVCASACKGACLACASRSSTALSSLNYIRNFDIRLSTSVCSKGIHVVHFGPLGTRNDIGRPIGWSKEISHMTRLVDHPFMLELGEKYSKSAVQIVLAKAMNSESYVVLRSVGDGQIDENFAAVELQLGAGDVAKIAELDVKARFNDPSLDHDRRV